MKNYNFLGKTEKELKEKIKTELNVEENEILVDITELKSGFLKSKKLSANVVKKDDIIIFIKEHIKKIMNLMGVDANLEVKKRAHDIKFLLSSNQNNILIGKNGKTIEALQFYLSQVIYNQIGMYFKITIDIGEYKLKKQKKIEFVAKKIARTVTRSKVPAILDPMNSFERRVVHTILSEYRGVTTVSEGEGRNRHVVIKPEE